MYIYTHKNRRPKVCCIEFSVQYCTLRPKTQDEGPVYGAYKTTSATVGGNYSAQIQCIAYPLHPRLNVGLGFESMRDDELTC